MNEALPDLEKIVSVILVVLGTASVVLLCLLVLDAINRISVAVCDLRTQIGKLAERLADSDSAVKTFEDKPDE